MTDPDPTPAAPRGRNKAVLIVFLVALTVAVVGITLAVASAGGDVKSRPGSPAVYSRIEGLTSCSELHAEFDTAAANFDSRDRQTCRTDLAEIDRSYMEAANERMDELGC